MIMNKFGLIFKHYFKRLMKDPLALGIQLGIPLVIILFMMNIDADTPFLGEVWATIASSFIIGFATFGGQWAMGHIYDDIKVDRRFRLLATPVNEGTFRSAAMLASMIISFTNSVIIILVTTITRPVIWGNLPILIVAVILIILLSHSFCYFITVVVKTYKVANALTNFILMGLAIIGGGIVVGIQNIVNIDAFTFIHDFVTPVSMGRQIIANGGMGVTSLVGGPGDVVVGHTDWSQVLLYVGILLGLTVLFAVLSFAFGKVKKA